MLSLVKKKLCVYIYIHLFIHISIYKYYRILSTIYYTHIDYVYIICEYTYILYPHICPYVYIYVYIYIMYILVVYISYIYYAYIFTYIFLDVQRYHMSHAINTLTQTHTYIHTYICMTFCLINLIFHKLGE